MFAIIEFFFHFQNHYFKSEGFILVISVFKIVLRDASFGSGRNSVGGSHFSGLRRVFPGYFELSEIFILLNCQTQKKKSSE